VKNLILALIFCIFSIGSVFAFAVEKAAEQKIPTKILNQSKSNLKNKKQYKNIDTNIEQKKDLIKKSKDWEDKKGKKRKEDRESFDDKYKQQQERFHKKANKLKNFLDSEIKKKDYNYTPSNVPSIPNDY
jgi:esterase/lipase